MLHFVNEVNFTLKVEYLYQKKEARISILLDGDVACSRFHLKQAEFGRKCWDLRDIKKENYLLLSGSSASGCGSSASGW